MGKRRRPGRWDQLYDKAEQAELEKKFTKSSNIFSGTLNKYKNVAVAFSGGKDSLINVILATMLYPEIKIFSVLTPYKFKETWEYIIQIEELYGLNLEIFMAYDCKPKILYNSGIAFTYYPDIWEEHQLENNPNDSILGYKRCCNLLKTQVLQRSIQDQNLDAFFSGLRSDETACRKDIPVFQENFGVTMVNTILDLNFNDVFKIAQQNDFPVNPLYDQGYRSLGCKPCTRISSPEETERDGRCFKDDRAVCEAFDSNVTGGTNSG